MTVEDAGRFLARAAAGANASGSWLICGGTAGEREQLGWFFARAVLCREKTADGPCGKCVDCRQASRKKHPDLHFMRGEGKNRLLQIEQVRQVRQEIFLAPYQAAFRFYLVDIANIREEAANAFLKTLEEPPETAVITLLSQAGYDLPPTVLSRLRKIRLPAPEPEAEMTGTWADFFSRSTENPAEIFTLSKKFAEASEDRKIALLDGLVTVLWRALRVREGLDENGEATAEWLSRLAQRAPTPAALRAIAEDAMRKRREIIGGTVSARLAVETILINLAVTGKNDPGRRAGN